MSTLKNNKEKYENYLSGKMRTKDAHTFEKEVLNDPFEQEALDGFETHDIAQAFSDIEKLQSAVLEEKKSGFNWMKIAATVALLIVGSLSIWLIVNPLSTGQELAMRKDNTALEERLTALNSSSEEPANLNLKSTETAKSEEEIIASEIKEESTNIAPVVADIVETEYENTDGQIEVADDLTTDFQDVSSGFTAQAKEEIPGDEATNKEAFADEDVSNTLQERASGIQIVAEKFQLDITSSLELVTQEVNKQNSEDKKTKSTSSGIGAASRRTYFALPPRVITGKISDDPDDGLSGAGVVMKGITTDTTTDLTGNYEINIEDNATLAISSVGFNMQEIEGGTQNSVDVTLEADVFELSEIVVTSSGIEDSSSRTYSPAKTGGGNRSYRKYLEENLNYPKAATENEIEGIVILELTISTFGNISNIDVKKSLGYGCDEEAMRLIREGPQWNPTQKNGNPVSDKITVQVKFRKN